MEQVLFLFFIGLIVGAYATLIGVGGGIILVPVLLLLYPTEKSEFITSTSLVVVFFSALSGTLAYARMKRINYKSGLIFSAGAIPGAILGALATTYIHRGLFDGIFGFLLLSLSIFILINPQRNESLKSSHNTFSPRLFSGFILNLLLGFISALLGFGGGIVNVPIFVYLLKFPTHVATATALFIATFIALISSSTHILTGVLSHGLKLPLPLVISIIIGSQIGARISQYIKARWIIRALAVVLMFVGIRIFIMAL